MKNIIFRLTLLIATTLCLHSCIDGAVGASLIDTGILVMEDSSFVITGHTERVARIQSRTTTQLLGIIKSDGYGTLKSEVVTEFMPSVMIDTLNVTANLIDSCELVLRIPKDGFTGDSDTPMRLSVFPLNKRLPSELYSDFNPTGYYDAEDHIADVAYSPSSAVTVVDSYISTTYEYLETRVPMPVEFARDVFNKFKSEPEIFKSPRRFGDYFPGLYIANSFGSGRMMNFAQTDLRVYYRKIIKTAAGNDSIADGFSMIYMAASPEVLCDNIIDMQLDPAVQERINNGEAIVMSPAGTEVRLNFPVQEIIDHYYAGTSEFFSTINAVTLTLPVEKVATGNSIAPPKTLLMVKTSKKDEFIEGDSLTNNKDSFYALYDEVNRCYTFTGLRAYVLNVINEHGGVATADDCDFSIIPIDLNTYVSTDTYNYTATTLVTKISPMVSAPSIARLRLDKAKVKITYNAQYVL